MDGVIFSSDDIIGQAYQNAIRDFMDKYNMNLTIPSHETIMNQIGKPSKLILQILFPDLDDAHQKEIGLYVLDNLIDDISTGKGKLYSGIAFILKELSQNRKLFLASNAREGYVDAILKYYELRAYFSGFIFLDDKISHKGEIIEEYIKKYAIFKDEIIMIGDRSSDRDAAQYAGCDFLGIMYGHGSEDELLGAKYFAKNPKDILAIIN